MKEELETYKTEYLQRRLEDLKTIANESLIEMIMMRLSECWDIASHKSAELVRKEEYELRKELLKD